VKMKIPAVLILCVFSVALALAQTSTNTTITTRPQSSFASFDFPGSTNTQATAITPSGEIVGRYFTADGKQHGFVLRDGVFTTLDVPGATFTDAAWVNASGAIVGGYSDSRGGHAYVLSGGTFTTIDFPSTTPVCTAGFGISNAGDVVGVEFVCSDFFHGDGYLLSHGQFTLLTGQSFLIFALFGSSAVVKQQ